MTSEKGYKYKKYFRGKFPATVFYRIHKQSIRVWKNDFHLCSVIGED